MTTVQHHPTPSATPAKQGVLDIATAMFLVDLYFFFQAEDGIRDLTVTGVQTCALPIFLHVGGRHVVVRQPHVGNVLEAQLLRSGIADLDHAGVVGRHRRLAIALRADGRSEERRVGKEGRAWGLSDCLTTRWARSAELRG